MIIDVLTNALCYAKLDDKVKTALDFLQDNSPADLAPGRYDIDGDKIFALVQTYETKSHDAGKWEAHRRYIDVQYVAEGVEQIGYANLDSLTITEPYNEENDVLFLEGEGNLLTVQAGTFAIFAPQDAHMPGLTLNNPRQVKKVVVKIEF